MAIRSSYASPVSGEIGAKLNEADRRKLLEIKNLADKVISFFREFRKNWILDLWIEIL